MITKKEQLIALLNLTEEEKRFYDTEEGMLPLKIPAHYASLIDTDNPNDPLRRQVVPSSEELKIDERTTLDPLAEEEYGVTERLIHRYPNRVAFLTTDICAIHCRHCFRRRFTATDQGPATSDQIKEAAAYVAEHPQVKEILFTGGDVLTLSNVQLKEMITTFRAVRPDLIIRLCTRMPAAHPARITDELVAMIKSFDSAPFYLMTQFNHPNELSEQAVAAVARFVDRGIMALNQSVLLSGVNDDVETLVLLSERLVQSRIVPYYLFQGDLVQSTAHLRVPLNKTLILEAELRKRVSGLGMPTLAVDLPHGGGKVPLSTHYLVGEREKGVWEFITVDGKKRFYYDPVY